MNRKRKLDHTANFVTPYPPRITRPVPAAPTQGASVFIAVAVILLVILAVLAVGIFGLIGYTQGWRPQITALWCLVGWGSAALFTLPWAISRTQSSGSNQIDTVRDFDSGGVGEL